MTTAIQPKPAVDRHSETAPGAGDRDAGLSSAPTARWWAAVAAASLAAIPCGIVLSFAALLPFFIGVFFFALFGLVLGAVAFRVASPRRPYGASAIVMGTTVIVLVTFGISLLKEGRDFPSDMSVRAIRQTRNIGTLTADEFRQKVAADVQEFLRTKYWPGGTAGYLRWTLTSGRIPKGTFDWMEKDLVFPQARYLFALRVALSLGLLAFGVASQTWMMRQRPVAKD